MIDRSASGFVRKVVGLSLVSAFTACSAGGGGGGGETSSPPSSAPPSVAATGSPLGTAVWLAGLKRASDPNSLDGMYARLQPVLDAALEVSPGTCFSGIPAPFDGPAYLVVVVAGSKAELDQLVAKAGEHPLFESKATVMCLD